MNKLTTYALVYLVPVALSLSILSCLILIFPLSSSLIAPRSSTWPVWRFLRIIFLLLTTSRPLLARDRFGISSGFPVLPPKSGFSACLWCAPTSVWKYGKRRSASNSVKRGYQGVWLALGPGGLVGQAAVNSNACITSRIQLSGPTSRRGSIVSKESKYGVRQIRAENNWNLFATVKNMLEIWGGVWEEQVILKSRTPYIVVCFKN